VADNTEQTIVEVLIRVAVDTTWQRPSTYELVLAHAIRHAVRDVHGVLEIEQCSTSHYQQKTVVVDPTVRLPPDKPGA
jgi:hypothetical protein